MLVDKNGNEIKEGLEVGFKRPVWDVNGEVTYIEVRERVQRLESGELFANNEEEDCFYIPFSEMEIID